MTEYDVAGRPEATVEEMEIHSADFRGSTLCERGLAHPNFGYPTLRGVRSVGTMLLRSRDFTFGCQADVWSLKSPAAISRNAQPSKTAKAGAANFISAQAKKSQRWASSRIRMGHPDSSSLFHSLPQQKSLIPVTNNLY